MLSQTLALLTVVISVISPRVVASAPIKRLDGSSGFDADDFTRLRELLAGPLPGRSRSQKVRDQVLSPQVRILLKRQFSTVFLSSKAMNPGMSQVAESKRPFFSKVANDECAFAVNARGQETAMILHADNKDLQSRVWTDGPPSIM
jgi:hypothetical protein